MDLFYLNIDNFDLIADTKHTLEHKAGRYVLNYAAKNFYNIKNTELEIINNKPKFKYSNINFSISHSKNIAAVCFDESPIGFDIEKIKQRDYNSIAKRMNFTLAEDTIEEFYKQWTLFEAEYKLQSEVKSNFSRIFLNDYMMSITSSKNINIKNILFIKEIKK